MSFKWDDLHIYLGGYFFLQFLWTKFGHHHIPFRESILHHLVHCWISSLFTFDWKHAGNNFASSYNESIYIHISVSNNSILVLSVILNLFLLHFPCGRHTCNR